MSTPRVITPTVGRQVWFWGLPKNSNPILGDGTIPTRLDATVPMAATVLFVHSDRMVNLEVLDHAGIAFRMTSVPLRQPDDEFPEGAHCEWMGFQIAQAAP